MVDLGRRLEEQYQRAERERADGEKILGLSERYFVKRRGLERKRRRNKNLGLSEKICEGKRNFARAQGPLLSDTTYFR